MAHEVFEKDEAAQALNAHFVSIKVDREERPDVDQLYMDTCMALNGSGGWPLNVFLTPLKEPFFATTYVNLNDFLSLVQRISGLYETQPERVTQLSHQVIKAIGLGEKPGRWDNNLPGQAFEALADRYDKVSGGFGGAPKFPSPQTLMFLQRYGLCYGEPKAAQMANFTLERMALGGINDQVGGGFFRYATDAAYLVPHFEKMLYDNAMLALVYSEFGHLDIAKRTLDFCKRELYAPQGAFYTALDADSEGKEGEYYLFTPNQVTVALGPDAGRYCQMFDIKPVGLINGKNLPNLHKTSRLSPQDLDFAMACHPKLLALREQRVRPQRDEKILLSSNSLMLSALATYARLAHQQDALNQAAGLAEFLLGNMKSNGRFYGVWVKGELQRHPAVQTDYAYLAWGLMRLHQATLDNRWLEACRNVCDEMLGLFWDGTGALWLTGKDVSDLPLRTQDAYDGALPSGNAIAAGVLQRLYQLTDVAVYKQAHDSIRNGLSAQAQAQPTAFAALLPTVMLEKRGVKVALPDDMKLVSGSYYPFATFVATPAPQATVCTWNACMPPLDSVDAVQTVLRNEAYH